MGHSAYTFTPNGKTIISGGGNGVLSAYNRSGNKLGDYIGHTGDVWAVAVSPDGRLLASASADQTVRLWNLDSRENLLTIFHGSDGEWVAWTPSGHYTSSPNGDKMVGWQINRGVNNAADYIEASQLAKQLNRPDIVANTVRLRSVKQALTMERANKGVNIMILDACRNSIPKDIFRKSKGVFKGAGLTNMNAPRGSLIAYATAPDKVSWGGLPSERNSVYTT